MGSLRPWQTILAAGLLCGVLDGISAVLAAGGRFTRVWQFVASGVLGPDSYKGGASTVALGIAVHFTVALGAAAVFYAASRAFPLLIDRAIVFGPLYGLAVHLFMSFVVIPLSAIGRRPFVLRSFLVMVAVHMIVVGPTIAFTVRRCSR